MSNYSLLFLWKGYVVQICLFMNDTSLGANKDKHKRDYGLLGLTSQITDVSMLISVVNLNISDQHKGAFVIFTLVAPPIGTVLYNTVQDFIRFGFLLGHALISSSVSTFLSL